MGALERKLSRRAATAGVQFAVSGNEPADPELYPGSIGLWRQKKEVKPAS
jgi:hypothetical protein